MKWFAEGAQTAHLCILYMIAGIFSIKTNLLYIKDLIMYIYMWETGKRHDWNIVESRAENIQGLSNANESDETLDNI